jgi:hypothetical protein
MRAALLAAVLLLAACTGASPDPSGDPVRILATDLPSVGEPFTVHLVQDSTDYMDGWRATGLPGSPPAIDFATEVAIYLGMAGSSSCPAAFERLVVDEATSHVYAEWNDQSLVGAPCTADLAPQGVLIAVARDVLPAAEFTLSLRDVLMCPDCPDHPDQELVSLR